jgi:hypothetical protein
MARLILLFLVACGGGAGMQTIMLVNKTPRGITEVFVYPANSSDHGASRGKLAAGASMTVQVKGGNVEVLATSETIQIDEKTRDTMQAGATLQLNRPLQVIFHDAEQPPPELQSKDVIGAAFRVLKPKTAEPEPEVTPAPEN